MKKFNELSKLGKGLVIVLVVFIGLCIVGSCSNPDVVEEGTEDNKTKVEQQEEQQQPEQKDEYVEPEYTKPEEEVELGSNEAEQALELVKPKIKKSFASMEGKYDLVLVNGCVVLRLNLTAEEIMQGVQLGQWNGLVENVKIASNNGKAYLESLGNSTSISIWVGEIENDNYYLCVMDGTVIYDAISELGY